MTTTRANTSYALGGSGVAVSCAANAGCYDSVSGLASNSQRINYWRDPLDASAWTTTGTSPVIATNIESGPFATVAGGAEVDTIQDDDAASFEGKCSAPVATVAGDVWTVSCYMGSSGATTQGLLQFLVTGGTGTANSVKTGLTSTLSRQTATSAALGVGATTIQACVYPEDQNVNTDVGTIKVTDCELVKSPVAVAPCIGTGAGPFTCNADVHTVPTTGWPTGSGEISVVYTPNSGGTPAANNILLDSRTTSTTQGIVLYRDTSNRIRFGTYSTSVQCLITPSASSWTAGTAYTIKAKWTPTTCEVLRDGVSVGTAVATGSPASHDAAANLGNNLSGAEQADGWESTLCLGLRCP